MSCRSDEAEDGPRELGPPSLPAALVSIRRPPEESRRHDELGARLAAAYGAAAIVGWMSNLIVGVSHKLFPGFVAAARAQRDRSPVPLVVLGMPDHLPPLVFALLNGGTLLVVLTLLAGWSSLLPIGGGLLALAGGLYAAGAGRTLLFTVRDPSGRPNPLAVLP